MSSELVRVILFSVIGFVIAVKLLLVFGALRGYSYGEETEKVLKGEKNEC